MQILPLPSESVMSAHNPESQVQILPPLQLLVQVRAMITDHGPDCLPESSGEILVILLG